MINQINMKFNRFIQIDNEKHHNLINIKDAIMDSFC